MSSYSEECSEHFIERANAKILHRLKKQNPEFLEQLRKVEYRDVWVSTAPEDPFLQKYARQFKSTGDEMIDVRSPEFVTVYRSLKDIEDIHKLDLNRSYVDDSSSSASGYGGDYDYDHVSDVDSWALHYTYRDGKDIFIEYNIPALFLSPDRRISRSEPYYIIDPDKLGDYGIKSVAMFVSRIARITERSKRYLTVRDPSVEWIEEEVVEKIIQNSSVITY